jgi:predicted dehydrogenase
MLTYIIKLSIKDINRKEENAMSAEKTRVCFIGCGDHANRFLYPSLSEIEKVQLKAVCSIDKAQAELNMKKHGADAFYLDYREMLEKEKPDAVLVVGPPKLHFDAGCFCLRDNIPFFIEKPPGENLKQAEKLLEESKKSEAFGQVGFMMRHSAIIRKARQIALAENLGDIRYGTVKYYTSGPYRSDKVYGLPGTDDMSFLWRYLIVQGVHPVNLGASFLGDISEITPEVIFSGENILVNIRLKNSSGNFFDITLHTFVAPGYGNLEFRSELVLDKGAVIETDNFSTLKFYPPAPLRPYQEGTDKNRLFWDFGTFGPNNMKMGYQAELMNFIDSVRTGKKPETGIKDACETMRILSEVQRIISEK